ncbi:hypothetical protein VTH06DRAFT_7033, partial [Thermothelomyces fergusii]
LLRLPPASTTLP